MTKCERAHHHGRVRKTMLYLRLPQLSGSMDSSSTYESHFLLLSVVAFAISWLARAIACDGINSNKGPLGLGRPSFVLKYFRMDSNDQVVVATHGDAFLIAIACRVILHWSRACVCICTIFSDRKYFAALIIRCRTYFEYLIFGHHCTSKKF